LGRVFFRKNGTGTHIQQFLREGSILMDLFITECRRFNRNIINKKITENNKNTLFNERK
jgi:hypothetical protein